MTTTFSPDEFDLDDGSVDLSTEMHEALEEYGGYSNWRNLPDAVDGLKPVARRALYSMFTLTKVVGGDKTKSSSVIGDIMKIHPHGDSGIYTALQTMSFVDDEGARPFRLNVPLVAGQGSWGDFDNGAASARYTECGLSDHALILLGKTDAFNRPTNEIHEGAINLVPSHDGKYLEPETFLPALFPNLVINGVETGIGMGVGTSCAPHNPREVMDLAIRMVDSPNPRWESVEAILPGPDLPCNAILFDSGKPGNNIRSYIETGKGSYVLRSRYEIEPYEISKKVTGHRINITGLPWGVSQSDMREKIAALIAEGKLPPMTTANYSSGKVGTLIVLDVEESDPEEVVARLINANVGFQTSYSVYMNVNVNGVIRQISVLEALRLWIDHRRGCVKRRSQHRLRVARERHEIVEGYIALSPIAEEVVALIRASDSRAQARVGLSERFSFTERQAEAILDLTISRLTRLATKEYVEEKERLEDLIGECERLLTDPSFLNKMIKEEMRAVRKIIGHERRNEYRAGELPSMAMPEAPAIEIPKQPRVLSVTDTGRIRVGVRKPKKNAVIGGFYEKHFTTSDHGIIEAFSSLGRHFPLAMNSATEKPTPAETFFPVELGEKIITVDCVTEDLGAPDLILMTTTGAIKRLDYTVWSRTKVGKTTSLIKLGDGEELAQAFFLPAGHDIGVLTSAGRFLLVSHEAVAAKGKAAGANRFVRLSNQEDRVMWAGAVSGSEAVTYWNANKVGQFLVSDVPYSNRHTLGTSITGLRSHIYGAVVGEAGAVSVGFYDEENDHEGSVPLEGVPQSLKTIGKSLEGCENLSKDSVTVTWLNHEN